MKRFVEKWKMFSKNQVFAVGIGMGLLVGAGATYLFFAFPREGMVYSSTDEHVTEPPPIQLYKAIPDNARRGEEIILRGGRFTRAGSVCFGTCEQKLDITSWSPSAVKATVASSIPAGSGELWVVDGSGAQTEKIPFTVVE